ncbi:MAG TPA: cupin domain-containing protein [Rhizomicrobium sp.]|jgi:mannose-6-phosphate isomerase-like protein (cupin superfamily)|nr:cupin domain-containing protein [Rhizomicrobium sp.]
MTNLPKRAPAATVFPDDAALRIGPSRVTILRDSWCAGVAQHDFESIGEGIVAYDLAPHLAAPRRLHWHTRESWTGTVLDGALTVRLADHDEVLQRGATIRVPAYCPFAWSNPGDMPARVVFTYSPGGFENYFREIAALLGAHPGLNLRDIAPQLPALWLRYGLEYEYC